MNVVQGVGYVGEVPMQYVLHQKNPMAVVQFVDQDTKAQFTFQIPMRDLEHFVSQIPNGGESNARTD